MVQGEKSSMLTATSCVARTSDPYARKAGFEAMQRADKGSSSSGNPFAAMATKAQAPAASSSFSSASSSKASSNGNSASGTSYGAWGPVFQNKQTFASMHFC